ncbi:MAG: histidine kinase N-terminal 7TM domain-containing protein, partial [Candidatus Saccharimonadales bacterium]
MLILTQTPFLFQSVSINGGTANPKPGPAIIFFVIHALVTIISGLASLCGKYRKATGTQKNQLLLIILASIVLWLIVPVTNFIITLAAETTTFVKFSPFYTLIFGAFITYAITAQKLFDIRAAVTRSVGYVLVLGAIALAYGLIFFGLIDIALAGHQRQLTRQILQIVLVAFLATSFPWLKKFFDRLTKHLFYRDSYDSQDVLDRLGNIVTAEIELHRILPSVHKILTESLKASFIDFALLRAGKFTLNRNSNIEDDGLETLTNHLKSRHSDLTVADALQPGPISQRLLNDNIALTLRLKAHEQIVGYVLIGGKRSGDSYNDQDYKLLLIVANELALAIQNALR